MTANAPAGARNLTAESVLDRAVELVDDEGLERLTIRRLAERCEVAVMTLYRHFATKERLLEALGERYMAEIEVPEVGHLRWQEQIVEALTAVSRGFLAHPHLGEIVALQHVDSVALFRATEIALGALREAGLSDRDAAWAFDAINSFATGFVVREADSRKRASAPSRRLRRIRELSSDEFRNVIELAGPLISLDAERRFEDGLRLLVEGIERRIEAGEGPGRETAG